MGSVKKSGTEFDLYLISFFRNSIFNRTLQTKLSKDLILP